MATKLKTELEATRIAWEKLAKLVGREDFEERTWTKREKNIIMVPFIGEKYFVDPVKREVSTSGGVAPEHHTLLILHYLLGATHQTPTNNLISFTQLRGGNIYYEAFKKRVIQPLVNRFGNHPKEFIEAAEKIGGKPLDKGDASATIKIFPKLPLTVILWRGDDEIPPGGNMLFDETAGLIMETEDLVVASSVLVAKLCSVANNPGKKSC